MNYTKILELTFRSLFITLLIALVYGPVYSQDITSARFLEFKYGFHLPVADMADRFGANSDIGLSVEMASLKSKVFYGVDGIFIFGSNVKEDVIAGLRTFDGTIIGRSGSPADINLKERGYYVGVHAGKIFPFGKYTHTLTGIRTQLGAGFLQHKIRVQDNFNNVIPLSGDHVKGFDRLTNGPAIHLAAGFQYQHPKSNFHFSLIGDLYGARTKSRREFDNASGGYLDKERTDILAGLTLSYIVAISRMSPPEEIYY